jgi:hypothetical protein
VNAAQVAEIAAFDQVLAEAATTIGMDPAELRAELREQVVDPRRGPATARLIAEMSDLELSVRYGADLADLMREYQHANAV